MTVRIGELDDVDFVLVAETCSEVVQLLLANQRVQGIGANPMPETQGYFQLKSIEVEKKVSPEDPPSDRDHPHNDGDHEHDVVHHVATKLAETASHVIAASLTRDYEWLHQFRKKISPTWLFLMHLKHLTMAIRRRRSRPMPVPPRISIQGMFGSAGQSGFGSPGATAWKIRRSRHVS